MARLFVLFVVWFTAFGAVAQAEQTREIECGGFYQVRAGDTLRIISAKAYGAREKASALYSANQGVIGPNPSAIRAGQRLNIPCFVAKNSAPTRRPMRVSLATTRIAPVGGDACSPAEAGIGLQITLEALRQDEPRQRILFERREGDVAVKVQDAMAVDLSLPWLKPACGDLSALSLAEQRLCQEFLWSDPLFVLVRGTFQRRVDMVNGGAGTLAASKICTVEGLGRDGADIRYNTIDQCLRDLMLGEVDAISAPVNDAYSAIYAKGLEAVIAEAPDLAVAEPIYGVVNKADQGGEANLARLNAGLGRLKQNGDLFKVATSYFHGEACAPKSMTLSGLKP